MFRSPAFLSTLNFSYRRLLLLVSALLLLGFYFIFHTRASGVYAVPPSIAADCSRPVQAELMDFIKTVPDGATIQFAANGCYGEAASLVVVDRNDLTFEGNGATLKTLSKTTQCQTNFLIQAGSNITIKNLTVRSTLPAGAFDGPRPSDADGAQCAHGFSFESTQGGSLLNSKAYNVWGDPVSIEPDVRKGDYCAVPPARNILVDGFEAANAGRTVGITNGDGIIIQNSSFGDLFDGAVDLEADVPCEWLHNIKFINNHFGRYHYAMINVWTNTVQADHLGMIEIRGNVTDVEPWSCYAPINIGAESPTNRVQLDNLIIADNDLRTIGQGINAQYVSNARIENNTLRNDYGLGCNGANYPANYGVWLDNAHNVNIYGNRLVDGYSDPNDPYHGFTGGLLHAGPSTSDITQNPPNSSPPAPTPIPTSSVPKPGDLNQDGKVDGADLSTVLRLYGTSDPAGDANGDGRVDGQDLSIVLRLYGA